MEIAVPLVVGGVGGAFCRDGVWGRASCAADAAGGAGAPDARIDGGEAAP